MYLCVGGGFIGVDIFLIIKVQTLLFTFSCQVSRRFAAKSSVVGFILAT